MVRGLLQVREKLVTDMTNETPTIVNTIYLVEEHTDFDGQPHFAEGYNALYFWSDGVVTWKEERP